MIVTGNKLRGKKNEVSTFGRCDRCGDLSEKVSDEGRMRFYLYCVPVFPVGEQMRVMCECHSCNYSKEVPMEELPGRLHKLHDKVNQAIVALGAGAVEFEYKLNSFRVLETIASSMKEFYCLVGQSEVDLLFEKLRASGDQKALLLADAKLAQLKGETKLADERYQQLIELDNDPWLRIQYARHLQESFRVAEAIPVAEEVEMELVTDLELKDFLIECYESTKQWDKIATTCESSLLIEPKLQSRDDFMKRYKKACKKAGREVV